MEVGLHSPPLLAPHHRTLPFLYHFLAIYSHSLSFIRNPSPSSFSPYKSINLTSFFASHSTNHTTNPGIKFENLSECMDTSVLEGQRAMLQRLHSWQNQERRDHVNVHSVFEPLDMLSNHWQPIKPDIQYLNETDHPILTYPETDRKRSYSPISGSNNNSSMTKDTMPKNDRQCNSSSVNREDSVSCSIKKRKAEFDVEEDVKDKGLEAEEAGEEKSEITTKPERELSTHTCSKESSKVSEVQKPDYIHVRARRGQATDSHSLAERARREKISKKMKCLQDLVPSCNKVTGKAGILDEIINYVQSLQKQVEFLSMKLAVSNPRLDFSIGDLLSKEIPPYITSLPEAATQLEASTSTCYQYNPMQQGTSNCGTDVSMDKSQMIPQKVGTSSVLIPEVFLDSSSIHQLQQLSGWDSDCPNLFNTGFHY